MNEPNVEVANWVTRVYEPAVQTIARVFRETGCTEEQAGHNARACLARLVKLEPPIVVELLKPEPRNVEDTG